MKKTLSRTRLYAVQNGYIITQEKEKIIHIKIHTVKIYIKFTVTNRINMGAVPQGHFNLIETNAYGVKIGH